MNSDADLGSAAPIEGVKTAPRPNPYLSPEEMSAYSRAVNFEERARLDAAQQLVGVEPHP